VVAFLDLFRGTRFLAWVLLALGIVGATNFLYSVTDFIGLIITIVLAILLAAVVICFVAIGVSSLAGRRPKRKAQLVERRESDPWMGFQTA
jgi:membrane protein implicated in regulation of membrane protease activity